MSREVENNIPTMWEELLSGTVEEAQIPEGDLVFRTGEIPRIALIRAGVVRLFIRTGTRQQVTVGYARRGDLIGLAPLLGGARTWNAEAIACTTLAIVTIEQVQAAAAVDPQTPWLIAEHIAVWASDTVRTVADNSSQPMAARVARHLGEIAVRTPDGSAVALISHQRLADAVGTAREVISRQLRLLRADGVIDTHPGCVTVLDQEQLQAIASGAS
jgi:CRP/FNR family transcriptional regulator